MNTLRWETSNARVSTQKFTDEVKYYRHPELSNSVQLSQLHYAIYIDTGTSIDKLLTCTASVYHLRRKNPRRQITTTIYRQPVTETALHRLANGSSNRLRTPPLKPAELHSVEFIRHRLWNYGLAPALGGRWQHDRAFSAPVNARSWPEALAALTARTTRDWCSQRSPGKDGGARRPVGCSASRRAPYQQRRGQRNLLRRR